MRSPRLSMKIHDEDTVSEVRWPDTRQGRLARDYLTPLVRARTGSSFSDDIAMRVVELDGLAFPIAIGEPGGNNSVNCSIVARYVRIPALAIPRLGWHPVLAAGARAVLAALGALLRLGAVDRCIYIGNGLILRGMEPALNADQVARLSEQLASAYPGHALVFAALNPVSHWPLLTHLKAQGYSFLFAGHTRIWTPHADIGTRQRYKQRQDAGLLPGSGYEIVDGTGLVEHAPRLAALYKALNRDKYSSNPAVSEAFFARALREGFIRFRLLVKRGKVDGFFGYAILNDVLCPPLFGYDLALPQSHGLYRILYSLMLDEAVANGAALETGAGADEFKRHRGDVPVARYGAFYTAHLPAHRRAVWRVLQRYANSLYANSTRAFLARVDGTDADGIHRIPEEFTPPCETPPRAAARLRREVAALADSVATWAASSAAQVGDSERVALYQGLASARQALERWPYPRELFDLPDAQVAELSRLLERADDAADASDETSRPPSLRRLLDTAEEIAGVALVVACIAGAEAAGLNEIARTLQERLRSGPAAIVLAGERDDKAALLCALSQDLVERDLAADEVLAAMLPFVEGRGGGRARFARGGGAALAGIPDALVAGRRYLVRRLGGGEPR